jgi:alkanesulfonate monooxygenase SsuD/methylene tetrahydromethanopterin reductase-like flavin-dependent oxidoreductase (luciferase family)
MWTQKRATFKGKYYSVNDAICNPKPIQKLHPVIMVGGEGERYLLKVVAKHADRYNHPSGSVQVLKRKISIIKEHCTSIGRVLRHYKHFIMQGVKCFLTLMIRYLLRQYFIDISDLLLIMTKR